jgi:hypothetical protein
VIVARAINRMVGLVSRFGLLRLLSQWLSLDRFGLWLTKPAEYAALCNDLASLERVPASMRASEDAGSLRPLSVIVITHGQPFPDSFAVLEKTGAKARSN